MINFIEKSSLKVNKIWYKSDIRERWNSLSDMERQCVNSAFGIKLYGMKDRFTDPCKEPEGRCKEFCKNSKILEKHLHSNKKLNDLVLYISHPTDVTVKGSQLQPFCSVGYETDEFEQKVLWRSVYQHENYSTEYEFCTSSYQRITDIGICTTTSFKEVKSNPKYFVFRFHFQTCKKKAFIFCLLRL